MSFLDDLENLPSGESGLTYLWHAPQGLTTTGVAEVTDWADLVSGKTFSTASVKNPIYADGVIQFRIADAQYMQTSGTGLFGDITWAVSLNQIGTPAENQIFWESSFFTYYIFLSILNGSTWVKGTLSGQPNYASSAVTPGKQVLLVQGGNISDKAIIRVDSLDEVNKTDTFPITHSSAVNISNGASPMNADIRAIAVYNRALTDVDKYYVEQVLADDMGGLLVPSGTPDEGDPLVYDLEDNAENNVTDGLIEMSGGIENLFYMLLFGGNIEDDGREANEFKWWGNLDEVDPNAKVVGRTATLLQDLPATSANLKRIEAAAQTDLSPALGIGLITELFVTATITSPNRLALVVEGNADGDKFEYVYTANWEALQ